MYIVVVLCYNLTMFIRKYVRRRADGTVDTRLVIARTYREGKKVYQEDVCRLGKLEELQASGQLDKLIQGLAQFSRQRWVSVGVVASGSETLPEQ